MATAPVKSQPLHNFPLSFLKWGQRCRRPAEPMPEKGSGGGKPEKEAEEEEEERVRNLRPRRAAPPVEVAEEAGPKSARLRGLSEGHVAERKVIWIALSREEIEEDVYAMTGGRPRRPKKRAKTVQKQLDGIFPGLYLDGVTADAYRVLEATK